MAKGYPDGSVGAAAASAAQASLHAAVATASKTGWKSSEFWVTVGGAGASAALAILVANPFGMIAAGAVAAGVAMYSASRGNVKASLGSAAITALGAVAKQGGAAGEVATVVGAVVSQATSNT